MNTPLCLAILGIVMPLAAQCPTAAATTTSMTVFGVAPGSANGNPVEIVVGDQIVWFTLAFSSSVANQLYGFDETTTAGHFVVPINGTAACTPQFLVPYGRDLLLAARVGQTSELRRVSPNAAFLTIPGGTQPQELVRVGDELFYTAVSPLTGGHRELWVCDLLTNTARLVYDVPLVNGDPAQITVIGSRVYFIATVLGGSRRLHVFDRGTGTANAFTSFAQPDDLTAVGPQLFFTGDPGSGNELCVSNGTIAGTRMISAIFPGSASRPNNLVEFAGECYFAASTGTAPGSSGRELWRSDGLTVSMVADINPGVGSGNPEGLTVAGSTLFFVARPNANHGREMHSYQVGGAPQLLCVNPTSNAFGNAVNTAALGESTIVASAHANNVVGREPWIYTPSGAQLLVITGPGTSSASRRPELYAATASFLYFAADTGAQGVEVCQVPLGGAGVPIARPYGAGCGGAGGVPTLSGNTPPLLGNASFELVGDRLLPNAAAILVGGFGQRNAASCGLLISSVVSTGLVFADGAGSFARPLPLPNNPSLAGLTVNWQFFAIDASTRRGYSSSNGLILFLF